MTRKTFILILFIVIVILYIAYKNKGKIKEQANSVVNPSIWPLDLGYTGEIVKDIQQKILRINPASQIVVDGTIGPSTKRELQRYVGFPLTEENYNLLTQLAA